MSGSEDVGETRDDRVWPVVTWTAEGREAGAQWLALEYAAAEPFQVAHREG